LDVAAFKLDPGSAFVTLLLGALCSFPANAQGSIKVNFRSGMTIPVGATFDVKGSALADGVAITNISVILGGAKIAEKSFNEPSVSFDFPLLRNNVPGQLDLVVTAQDAAGAAFSSQPFTTYFPAHVSARWLTPTNNVTLALGNGLLLRAGTDIDIGQVDGLLFWIDSGNDYAKSYNTASPGEVTWYPQNPGTYQVAVIPRLDIDGPVHGAGFTATVMNWKLPVITRQSLYLGDTNGGKTMLVESSSDAPQTIQWLHNGQPIAGATQSIFTIESPKPGDDGYYVAQIDNFEGRVVSAMADQAIDGNGGGRVLFSNHTDGIDAPIDSPGQLSGEPPYIRVRLIAGATINRMRPVTSEIEVTNGYFDAGTITLPQIAPGQKAYVQLTARDEIPFLLEGPLFGLSPIMEIIAGASEPARLPRLKPLTLQKGGPYLWPEFTPDTPPSVREGGSVELKVHLQTASPETNVTFFWSKNGTPIAGATNLTFRIENAQRSDAAYYTVFVTDGTLWREIGMALAVENSVGLHLLSNGQLQLRGNIGSRYTLQRSTNLNTWSPLQTITAASETTAITVAAPSGGNVFYRAVLEPN
jgi:hypothetical protein